MPYKDLEKRRECSGRTALKYKEKYKDRYRGRYTETHLRWRRGNKEYLEKRRSYYRKNIHKARARYVLYNAIKAGRVVRGDCIVCKTPMAHGHHQDYNKPLEVVWLCRKHHMEIHHTVL